MNARLTRANRPANISRCFTRLGKCSDDRRVATRRNRYCPASAAARCSCTSAPPLHDAKLTSFFPRTPRPRRRSVGGGVAALSFDEEFQRRRINRRREAGGAGGVDRRTGGRGGPPGAARMMVHAVRDLGGGIYHGVTGVMVEPYRRAKVSPLCCCCNWFRVGSWPRV